MNPPKESIALVFVLVLTILLPARSGADSIYDTMEEYWKDAMPAEAFAPTPYGADSRFGPKRIWVRLDKAMRPGSPKRARTTNAWFVFSNGLSVYPDDLVAIQKESIVLPTLGLDKARKLALGVSLAGSIEGAGVEAAFNLASSKNIDVKIDIGEATLEYVYYFDMVIAQELRFERLNVMSQVINQRGGDPSRRVITAAIKVRNTDISVTMGGAFEAGANVDVVEAFEKLGFSWNSTRNRFETLAVGEDWKYVAYQAIKTDARGKIAGSGLAEGEEWNSYALPSENRQWTEP